MQTNSRRHRYPSSRLHAPMHIALPHTRTHAKPIYMLLDHRYTTRMPLLYNANAYGNATGCRDVGWWADGGRLMGCRHVSRPVRYASVTSTSFTFSRPIDDTLRHFMQAISSRTAKPGDCIHFEGLRTRRPAAPTPHVIIGVRSSDEYIYIAHARHTANANGTWELRSSIIRTSTSTRNTR